MSRGNEVELERVGEVLVWLFVEPFDLGEG